MKKIVLIICLFLGISQTSFAQIDFGLKAGVNYNDTGNDSFKAIGDDISNGANERFGYHAGLWFRGKLPILGLYLRPEIVYTEVKSQYVDNTSVITDYKFKKIDVPVLLGKRFFTVVTVFIGPSFQYILDENFEVNNLKTDDFDKFSVGTQMGFGVEFGSLGIDVRWERGLSNTEAKFVSNANDIKIDNRTNQIIVGLSLKI